LRQAGKIGSSLQAEVLITLPAADVAIVGALGDDLKFVLITSTAKALPGVSQQIAATLSAHKKCDRCWHYRSDVGADPEHPQLCGRCLSNLFGTGEVRRHA
jgi:isoleucyl-tRNA synthetase